MIEIRLPRGKWEYDPNSPLGKPGGFGAVFAGRGEEYGTVAIKKLHLSASDAAHRELRIADELTERSLKRVIPIYDAGQDANSDSYFLVMALAERSLRQEIERIGAFTEREAIQILLDVAGGLNEVQDIVHRDLKPANVLYHEGHWKVADFGIARFVEESTSLQTLRGFLSPPYAAPEQWQFESATSATDIYALGCIGYALLTGQPPFSGPRREESRLQHLQEAPPQLEAGNPALRSLLSIMLRKLPEARPSLSRVREMLSEIVSAHYEQNVPSEGSGLAALAQVGVELAERDAEAEARRVEEELGFRERLRIARGAWDILIELAERLFDKAMKVVPTAQGPASSGMDYHLEVGTATLTIQQIGSGGAFVPGAFSKSGWDVIVGGIIGVHQKEPSYSRSASLWYTDLGSGEGAYRWYEVSYFAPLDPYPAPNTPYALSGLLEADEAACGEGEHSMATSPRPIDDEDANDFFDRWLGILAEACQGELQSPRHLPLD